MIDDFVEESTCKCCGKEFNITSRTPLFYDVWRQSFDAEEFCSTKCCASYARKNGVKKQCKHCNRDFYVLKHNSPQFLFYCNEACVDSNLSEQVSDTFRFTGN